MAGGCFRHKKSNFFFHGQRRALQLVSNNRETRQQLFRYILASTVNKVELFLDILNVF